VPQIAPFSANCVPRGYLRAVDKLLMRRERPTGDGTLKAHASAMPRGLGGPGMHAAVSARSTPRPDDPACLNGCAGWLHAPGRPALDPSRPAGKRRAEIEPYSPGRRGRSMSARSAALLLDEGPFEIQPSSADAGGGISGLAVAVAWSPPATRSRLASGEIQSAA